MKGLWANNSCFSFPCFEGTAIQLERKRGELEGGNGIRDGEEMWAKEKIIGSKKGRGTAHGQYNLLLRK